MRRADRRGGAMRTRFFEVCAAAVIALAGCAPAGGQTTGSTAPRDRPVGQRGVQWTYDATVASNADGVGVRMCFPGRPSKALRPIVSEAIAHIEGLAIEGRDAPLAIEDGVVVLEGMRAGECVRWRVDFRAMAKREGERTIAWVGDSVLVRQSMWLLWPDDATIDAHPTLTLHLPAGTSASVPWPLTEGATTGSAPNYVLDTTVSRWLGYNAFGRLDIDRFEHKGAAVEIVRLDQPIACDQAGVRRWLTDAIDGAAMLYDTYPRRRLQVVVVPVAGGDGTIYFGAAARGGGAGVYLLLDDAATAERLPGGWTTVHELLHHGMPFVSDPWMSEGFVSYYTEVVRTRQGHRDEAAGWLELWLAFERGAGRGRGMTLRETSDAMHQSHAYQRVYWGGAAIALDLDVTMRLETGGKRTFDDAMKHLRECCGDAVFQYDADELLAILDRWYGTPLFTRIARAHLDARGFPDIASIFARLGMRAKAGVIEIDADHPAAGARAAIMAPR